MEEIKNISKKPKNNILSISFLIIVILSTWFMHFYNSIITKNIEEIKTNITSIEWNISEVKKDKNLQIFSLLEDNKSILNSYKLMNNISKYINHLNVIQAKYDLKFTWFSLNNWVLNSSIEFVSDDNWIAFQKARDFIKNYRMDKKALFELDFINQIQWMDKIKFNVSFKIK